jgi:FKBP-type peptidyl-prolyl cis-trans isomerase
MRILLVAGSMLALAACGEAAAPTAPAPDAPMPPAAGVKTPDAAAWAKYAPWNSDLPEVVKTGSGLECVELASGPETGVPPKASEQAEVFYEGPAFDSAFERNESSTFPVSAVVDGFSEALQLMKPGDRQICYLPYQLAYGTAGRGAIPPAADLLFEIELVGVTP